MNKLVFGITDNSLMQSYAQRGMRVIEQKCRGIKCLAKELRIREESGAEALIKALYRREIDIAAFELWELDQFISDRDEGLTIAAFVRDVDDRYVLMTRRKDSKHFANAVVEVCDSNSGFQLADRFDGVLCVPQAGGALVQIDRLSREKCDGILLPSAQVINLAANKNLSYRYNYLDRETVTPHMGRGIIALVCRQDLECINELERASAVKVIKKLEIERTISIRIREAVCENRERCSYSVCAQIIKGKFKVLIYLRKNGVGRHFSGGGSYSDKEKIIADIIDEIIKYLED